MRNPQSQQSEEESKGPQSEEESKGPLRNQQVPGLRAEPAMSQRYSSGKPPSADEPNILQQIIESVDDGESLLTNKLPIQRLITKYSQFPNLSPQEYKDLDKQIGGKLSLLFKETQME